MTEEKRGKNVAIFGTILQTAAMAAMLAMWLLTKSLAAMVFGRRRAERWKKTPGKRRAILKDALQNCQTYRTDDGRVAIASSAKAYALILADLAREMQCPLLVGAATGHPNANPIDRWDHWVMRNSALLFVPREESDPNRHLAVAQYATRHPLPFSEIVARIRENIPDIGEICTHCTSSSPNGFASFREGLRRGI